jgi:hypothetical protein
MGFIFSLFAILLIMKGQGECDVGVFLIKNLLFIYLFI